MITASPARGRTPEHKCIVSTAALQFAAVLNESKKKCREWQAKAQQAEERLENVRRCCTLLS